MKSPPSVLLDLSTLLMAAQVQDLLEPTASGREVALFAPSGFLDFLSRAPPQVLIAVADEYGFQIDGRDARAIRSNVSRLRAIVRTYSVPETRWKTYLNRKDIVGIAANVHEAFHRIAELSRESLVRGVLEFIHGLEEGFQSQHRRRLVGLLAGSDPLMLRTSRFLGYGSRVVVNTVVGASEALWQPLQRYGRRKAKFWSGMSNVAKAKLAAAGASLFLAIAFVGPWTPAEVARHLATEGEHAASVVYFLIDKHSSISVSDMSLLQ